MRKPRAIVCDDNGVILVLFRRISEGIGYEVLTAATPITCAFYREHVDSCPQYERCTDVLLTDQEMPGMTGIELLELQHHKGCKLTSKNKALMTGYADPVLQRRAAELGCHFFKKPLLSSDLLAWLKECEERLDLSEPLTSDLFLPFKKESLDVVPQK